MPRNVTWSHLTGGAGRGGRRGERPSFQKKKAAQKVLL